MAYGPHDTRDLALPAGWDATYLQKFTLKEGITYDRLVQDLQAAVRAFNQEAKPLIDPLVYGNIEPQVEYGYGVAAWEDATEYGKPTPQRGIVTGHMIPLLRKDVALGWTWNFLREARMAQIDEDVRSAFAGARDLYDLLVMRRIFITADGTVGTAGVSAGWVGAGSVGYTPRPYNGKTFSGHSHLLRYDTVANGIDPLIATVKEHGHGDLLLYVSESDEASVRALTGFVPAAYPGITYANTTLAQPMSLPGFIGVYNGARVIVKPRVPQYYLACLATYGTDDARNPLRWRYNELDGDGVLLRMGANGTNPLIDTTFYREVGVGVNDRTAGAVLYVHASGSYVDPSIS